jgi:Protein of unknown function (DUF2442)
VYPRVTEVRHLGNYRLAVSFEDGVEAHLDFAPLVERGGIFAPLREVATFASVRIDTVAETLVWPGGADICPDVLYHLATGAPLPGELPHRAATLVHVNRPGAKARTA